MKVLIIGGEGYVGSYLFRYLQNLNVDVQCYGNRRVDYNNLGRIYLQQFTHIVLLAGHSSVQCCDGPLLSPWKNNVRNFKNLVDKIESNQTIIYASSASVYGDKDTNRFYTEDEISSEYVNNYDLTKVSLDLLAMKLMNEGHNLVGLRFGTVNGGSSIIRRDLMINSMVWSALNTGTITVTNKHVKRPILSIRDLAKAVHTILVNNVKRDIYNLASFNSTVGEIASIVREFTHADIIDKGTTSTYNFAIDTTKFKHLHGFTYDDNVHSVVDNVIDCYKSKNPIIAARSEYFQYD